MGELVLDLSQMMTSYVTKVTVHQTTVHSSTRVLDVSKIGSQYEECEMDHNQQNWRRKRSAKLLHRHE